MAEQRFDQYAEQYDAWFMENRNVLESEVRLLKRAVGTPGKALSVGCGSGLFEHLLRTEHGVAIERGVEPAEGMAVIARRRGMTVEIGTAEVLPVRETDFDTVIFNGSPSYIADLARAFQRAWDVLRPGGRIVVLDVPAESSYALLYRLGGALGTWDHKCFEGVRPDSVYPLALAAGANWRTTPEKVALLERVGFVDFAYFQTLTVHPRYSNERFEEPIEGYDRGDYVAIRARKPE